jgi:predicted amidohydrolase
VLELPARWAEPEAALQEVERLVAARPTDLAILPELALTGYVSPDGEFDLTRFAEPLDGPTVRSVADICRRHAVHLVAPLVLAENSDVFNAAVVVDPHGRVVATYRKRHPWFPEQWATPGALPSPIFAIGDVAVTIAICFDGHFLADDSKDALLRADLLVFTSAWVDEEDSRIPLLRSLARQFRISIANANWGPGIVLVPGQGGSCVLDRRAALVASVPTDERRADALIHPRHPRQRR